MTPFPVDLDAEAIFVDGNWYTREDLARRIKAMLDQGDFTVARPSSALEQLTHALHSVRTMAFRAPPDLAEAISQIANRSGVSVGQVLREAAMGMVMASRAERREDTARVPIPQPPAGPVVTPAPAVAETTGAVIAGPGALRTAGVTAEDKPVELTNPKKPNEETSAEHRWFKQ